MANTERPHEPCSHLRQTLASLDSREQAMILGHAVPMPVVFQARKYDQAFYAAISPFAGQRELVQARAYEELFPGED